MIKESRIKIIIGGKYSIYTIKELSTGWNSWLLLAGKKSKQISFPSNRDSSGWSTTIISSFLDS
jgi:hypothetical protein